MHGAYIPTLPGTVAPRPPAKGHPFLERDREPSKGPCAGKGKGKGTSASATQTSLLPVSAGVLGASAGAVFVPTKVLTSAIALTIALAWNDASRAIIEYAYPSPTSSSVWRAKVLYAASLTAFVLATLHFINLSVTVVGHVTDTLRRRSVIPCGSLPGLGIGGGLGPARET